jgi:hypothetical protein
MAKKRPGIKTSSAKAKGRLHQQWICKRILKAFPWLEEGDIESRSMGAGGVDILLSPAAKRAFPVSIEAKKTRKTPSRSEIEQARANAYGTTLPAVVWAPHGSGSDKSLIMMDFGDFVDWVKDLLHEDD